VLTTLCKKIHEEREKENISFIIKVPIHKNSPCM